jgi:hypothetical protein
VTVVGEADGKSDAPGNGTYIAKCTTCGLSKRFYTELGASGFQLDHAEHDVVVDRPSELTQAWVADHGPDPRPSENQPVVEAQATLAETAEADKESASPTAIELPDAAGQTVTLQTTASEKHAAFLLASSFYLQDGEEVEKEALRISGALNDLKWGVEPPYAISVMIDENVGIEANRSTITADVVERIESLGYKFVAVNAPNGKPIAWFKREESESEGGAAPSRPALRGTLDSVRDLETLAKKLEVEKRKLAQEKSAWEERSSVVVSLLKEIVSTLER